MKKLLLLSLLCLAALQVSAQGYFHEQRQSLFETLPIKSKDIVMLGNSITNGGEWVELTGNRHVKNRGISGDRTQWLLDRLPSITAGKPRKVFLLIGTNDLAGGVSKEQTLENILRIVERIHQESPRTRVYVQSILPVNEEAPKTPFSNHVRNNEPIRWVNQALQAQAQAKGYTYVDLHSRFVNAQGKMDLQYSNDGLHLLGKGYQHWVSIIRPLL